MGQGLDSPKPLLGLPIFSARIGSESQSCEALSSFAHGTFRRKRAHLETKFSVENGPTLRQESLGREEEM
jgi:hypothetical protein